MLSRATIGYIAAHRGDDVLRLALTAVPADVDRAAALEQIAGWQTARRKLPSWAAVDGIVYPPRLAMEQCSGEPAAAYKRAVARRLLPAERRLVLTDLTGGLGVDFAFLAPLFRRAVYVERQSVLCSLARHNMAALGLNGVEVVCGEAADYLRSMPHVSMTYVDPARRNADGRRTYALADCSPDVTALAPQLRSLADVTLLKLSPMLDMAKTLSDLAPVSELHIVATDNECKELLVVLHGDAPQPLDGPMVYCVNDGHTFSYPYAEQVYEPLPVAAPAPGLFLYEPWAPLMKAGCFGLLCRRYGVSTLSANSHLFISPREIATFPGRRFLIDGVTTMNRRELSRALRGIDRANITTRNFPLTADALRRRLALRDGGDVCLFATTVGRQHLIIYTRARATAVG